MNIATDSNTLALLIEDFRSREQLGIAKYGVTIDRTDMNHVEWLRHALEEDMDRCLYMKRAIDTALELINERNKLMEALETIANLGAMDGLNAKIMARKALAGESAA